MSKKILLLDFDEVICFSGYLPLVNEFLGTSYVIDDFTDYYIDEAAIPKDRMEEFKDFCKNRNLYENAFVLPNAIEVLRRLNEVVDIYICSDCLDPFDIKNSGRIYKDKFDFLIEHLPFISPKKFIFTGTKHLFKADMQIDDRLSNLDNDIETKILFPSYHNKGISEYELMEKGVIRAGLEWRTGWLEVERIINELLKNDIKTLKH